MDTFANLERQLASLESAQFRTITSVLAGGSSLPSSAVHGGIQTAALEDSTRAISNPLPVVVAVGINYTQSVRGATFPIFHHYRGTTAAGSPIVTDSALPMRNATRFAIDACQRNNSDWQAASLASPGIPVIPNNEYHLVALNLSPFITLKLWGSLTSPEANAILSAWPWLPHLNVCLSALPAVDLWIGHGMAFVHGTFSTWRSSYGLRPWMLTYNLSGLGLGNMRKAQRNPTHPAHDLYK